MPYPEKFLKNSWGGGCWKIFQILIGGGGGWNNNGVKKLINLKMHPINKQQRCSLFLLSFLSFSLTSSPYPFLYFSTSSSKVSFSSFEYFVLSWHANFVVLLIVIISAMKCSPFTVDISPCIQSDNSIFAHVRNWWDEILLQCKNFF